MHRTSVGPLSKARRGIAAYLLMVLLVISGSAFGASRSSGQALATVNGTGEIPKGSYKTWSLFLVCNPSWLTPEKSKDLFNLYSQFQSFGQTIGDGNLAVWFWKEKKSANDPDLAKNVDVDRSVKLCKALNLKPSESPEIVVMSAYPDENHLPTEFAAFQLAQMNAQDISSLLAKLSDQLLLQDKVTQQPATTDPAPQAHLWIRLLSAAQQVIGNFGCAWSLKIDTGVLTAELHSCQQS